MKKISLCVLFFFPSIFFEPEQPKTDPVQVVENKLDHLNAEIQEMNELLRNENL